MKLRIKALITISALCLLFSIVMVTERAIGFRKTLLERTQDRTDYLSSFVIELSVHYLETGNIQRLKEILKSFDHFRNLSYLRLVDSRGEVVYRMAEPGVKLTDKKPDEDVFHPSDEMFDVTQEIISNGVHLGYVQLGISVKGVNEAVANLAWRGIPENFREEIFKKYSTMGKSPKNLGLGLAFCKLVADRHAAALDVRSEVGEGTEISFVIPVSRENIPAGTQPG